MRNSALSSGALPLKPRDLSLLRQNRSATSGRLPPPRPFRHLNRRSGRISALPYPPLRCFQNGPYRPSPAMIFHWTATTLLTCCLTPGVQFRADVAPRPGSVTNLQQNRAILARNLEAQRADTNANVHDHNTGYRNPGARRSGNGCRSDHRNLATQPLPIKVLAGILGDGRSTTKTAH
jgi:hypothetical protein